MGLTRRAGPLVVLLGLVAASAGCGSSSQDPVESPSFGESPPSFVELGDLAVTVDGATTRLGDSTLRYHRRTVDYFDDPQTPAHDGMSGQIQRFMRCDIDQWSIGGQIFTVDIIAEGIYRRDPTLIERGAIGVDWGVGVPLGHDGVHSLSRDCDDTTVEDYGGTHHSTQWLVALGTAVHLLQALDGDEHDERIDRYVERIEEIAERLVDPDNTAEWAKRWLVDRDDNIFTHKTFMRAAALQLAASLTEDAAHASAWVEEAESIIRDGLAAQRADGALPERGGYDVSYQMYGTWLAQLYLSVLAEDSPVRTEVEDMIDRSIAWMVERTDPDTGQVDIGESTRTCSEIDGYARFDAAVQVRVFLYHALTSPDQDHLVDLAALVDRGARELGNTCPPRTSAPPRT
jgi:hypothetical protein